MTIERLERLKQKTERARDLLHETHMELTIDLVLELIEAAKLKTDQVNPH